LTASYSGLVNGDTAASLTVAPTLSTAATVASHVGSYAITASGAVDPDYTIAYVPGSLTVTPAALTITADDQSKVYGAALPPLTASYSGLVNGDSAASLRTAPNLSTTATSGSHTGSYPILVAGAADPDYAIIYVPGTLTVTVATITVTVQDTAKIYGDANPAFFVQFTGFVNGDDPSTLAGSLVYQTAATSASHVGSYTVDAAGLSSTDYAIRFVAGTLAITPAALIITVDDSGKAPGEPNPPFTVSYRGFVNGDNPASLSGTLQFTTSADSASAPGTYTVTASGLKSRDYAITYVKGTLTVHSEVVPVQPPGNGAPPPVKPPPVSVIVPPPALPPPPNSPWYTGYNDSPSFVGLDLNEAEERRRLDNVASITPPTAVPDAPIPSIADERPEEPIPPMQPQPVPARPGVATTTPTLPAPRLGPLTTRLVAMALPFQEPEGLQRTLAIALGSTTIAAAAGYAAMHVRVLSLILSSLSATPLWSKLDPLAILDGWERRQNRKRRRSDRAEDDPDETSEQLFN
jgi:hypothetical protein